MNPSALARYSSFTRQIFFTVKQNIFWHNKRWFHLPGDVVHDEEGDGPLVVPGHLAGVGVTPSHLGPQRLRLVHICLVAGGLGDPGSRPDNLVIVATPGLVETTSRDGVSVLSFMEKIYQQWKDLDLPWYKKSF